MGGKLGIHSVSNTKNDIKLMTFLPRIRRGPPVIENGKSISEAGTPFNMTRMSGITREACHCRIGAAHPWYNTYIAAHP
jgi:hypothetical protein